VVYGGGGGGGGAGSWDMWTAKRFFSIIMDTRNGDVSYKLSVGLFITNKMGQ
jgi:hypothetical protein